MWRSNMSELVEVTESELKELMALAETKKRRKEKFKKDKEKIVEVLNALSEGVNTNKDKLLLRLVPASVGFKLKIRDRRTENLIFKLYQAIEDYIYSI